MSVAVTLVWVFGVVVVGVCLILLLMHGLDRLSNRIFGNDGVGGLVFFVLMMAAIWSFILTAMIISDQEQKSAQVEVGQPCE